MAEILTDQTFYDIVETIREPLLIIDQDLRVLIANRSFYDFFKVKPEETVGQLIYNLGNKQWDIPKLRELLENILPEKTAFDNYEVEHDFATIGKRIMLLNARQIEQGTGKERIILLAIEDITERKEIEVGLEKTRKELEIIKKSADEAHEFADSVIDTVREPLISLDQDLRVVTVSRSFYDFFKVTPEETVGQLIYNLGNKQWDIPKLRELLENILPEKTAFDNYEVEHDFATIGRRTMLLNARQIEQVMGKERIILLAIEDITERKQLEDVLTESVERYRRIFETATDGILLFDKGGLTIRHANPAIEEMLGYSKEELIGKDLKNIGFLDYIGSFQEVMQTLKEVGIFHFKNALIQKKTGQVVNTDIYMVDKTGLVQCNIRDVSERSRLETLLSEKRFRNLLDISIIGISIIQDNRIVYQNQEMEKLLGPLPRPNKLTDIKSIHPDDIENVKAFYKKSTSDKVQEINFRFYTVDDSGKGLDMKWVHYRTSPIEYHGKNALLVNIMDLTKTRELERLLIIQDKMASLGRVAAGIAHEIRNPLTSINIYLAVLKKNHHRDGSEEEVEQILKQLQIASTKIEFVIRRVMDFSKPGELMLTLIDINEPITDAINLTAASMRKSSIKIDKILKNDLPQSYADKNLIEQMVLNLLNNAAEAMQNMETGKKVAVVSFVKDDRIIIQISDSGPGVPEEIRDKILDPYYTTKQEGTGIGLSLCHRIIMDHGGSIDVSPGKWGGAEFSIEIPISGYN